MNKSRIKFLNGMVFLLLAQTMVGINIVFSKYLVASIPSLYILTLRFTLAAVILLPLHWLTPAKKYPLYSYFSKVSGRDWIFILGQALTAGILFNFLILGGLNYTDANVAGIITSALPAIIAILSWAILGEKISGKKAVCVVFATLGLVVIAFDRIKGVRLVHSFWGDALVMASLLPEASYYILTKMHSNSLPVFLISSLLNGINAILLIVCLAFTTSNDLTINVLDWLTLFILGLSSGFFYVFWYFGSQKVDGVMASLSTAVMPITTVIFAWMFLGEQLTLGQIIGMAMILFSIAIYAKY